MSTNSYVVVAIIRALSMDKLLYIFGHYLILLPVVCGGSMARIILKFMSVLLDAR